MSREEAATLLGVDPEADPEDVRRAWRVWARLAHPDTGGDVEHFRRLAAAKDTLLADTPLDPNPTLIPTPRSPLRSVLRWPAPRALAAGAVLTLIAVVSIVVVQWVDPWIAALILGTTTTSMAWWLQRTLLVPTADVGHRITTLSLIWAPIAVVDVMAAQALGSSVVAALPALALPFVVAVALVNPGAGLWRPIRLPR